MRLVVIVIAIAIAATIAADRLSKDVQPAKGAAATVRPIENPSPEKLRPAANGAEAEPRRRAQQLPLAADAPGCFPGQPMTMVADRSGHFVTDVEINGRKISMVIDTGASVVTIPHEEALRIGLNLANGKKVTFQTANGPAQSTITRAASLRIGPICLYDVEVAVPAPHALGSGLLGMNVIGKMKRFELSDSRLTIAR